MAIYHLSAGIVSRARGLSAVAKSAYNSCDKIRNEYDGTTHNYSNKPEHTYHEILLPDNAPTEYMDKSKLWNAVELSEKNKNAQLCRSFDIALPKELSKEEQEKLIHDFCKENFSDRGMCVQIDIHSKQENPHAHVMTTLREIDENGKWKSKQFKEYFCQNGNEQRYFKPGEIPDGWEKIIGKNGKPKTRAVDCNNWNSKEFLLEIRKSWADKCNEKLREKQVEEISHLSHKDLGKDTIPQVHLGSYNYKLMREGKTNERIEKYKNIIEWNKRIEELKQRLIEVFEKFKAEISKPIISVEEKINEIREQSKLSKMQTISKQELLDKRDELLMVRDSKQRELDNLTGFFKGKQRAELQEQISDLKIKIDKIDHELQRRRSLEKQTTAPTAPEKHREDRQKIIEDRQQQTMQHEKLYEDLFQRLDQKSQSIDMGSGYGIKPKPKANNDFNKMRGLDKMNENLQKAQQEREARAELKNKANKNKSGRDR